MFRVPNDAETPRMDDTTKISFRRWFTSSRSDRDEWVRRRNVAQKIAHQEWAGPDERLLDTPAHTTRGEDPAMTATDQPQSGFEQAPTKNWFLRHKVVTGLLVVLALGAVGSQLSDEEPAVTDAPSSSTTDEPEPEPEPEPAYDLSEDSISATVMCEEFVTDRLRSPSTADFPWTSERETYNPKRNTWTIVSYVDSQNGFGAEVRTDWVCEITSSDGENWTLVDLITR